MASTFPGAIDNFTNPLSNSALNSPSHSGQHSDLNDAVNKVETYMGLVKVIPTSVTGGTLSATGTITITAGSATVVVSGAFSSLYDNYRIVGANIQASASQSLCFYIGTNATSGLYYGSEYYDRYDAASTGTARRNGGNNGYIGLSDSAGANLGTSIDLNSPFLTKQKTWHGTYDGRNYAGWFGGLVADSTSCTQIVFLNESGTLTAGTIRIYGYRN